MFVILPFEKDFYKKFGMEVEYVGHPLIDAIEQYNSESIDQVMNFKNKNGLDERPIIAILPGSRKQEIKTKLPIMLGALNGLEGFQVVIAGAPAQELELYQEFLKKDEQIVFDQTYALLSNSAAAIVTSGTATLETAIFKVPQVVCYKGSGISYQIAKRLVKVDYISLVNLIMGREVVKELIQDECTSKNIREELDKLIGSEDYRNSMVREYKELRSILGEGGASEKVAQSLLKTIR
jgi:lipid-A-disaccharide synthase